jgi:Rieske Fe-S protein
LVPDPHWRRDFPYTSSGEDLVTRRAFTRYLMAASGAFAAGSLGVAGIASVRRVDHGEPAPIVAVADVPSDTSYLFRYPTHDDPAILVNLGAAGLRAYSQKCTHLGCVVYWDEDGHELRCPCHHGSFDASTGDPIAGPPDRPLGVIEIEVRDGMVWAQRATA